MRHCAMGNCLRFSCSNFIFVRAYLLQTRKVQDMSHRLEEHTEIYIVSWGACRNVQDFSSWTAQNFHWSSSRVWENCVPSVGSWLLISPLTGWWFGTVFIFLYIGNVIIPTDELIFFRWVGQPPTSFIFYYIVILSYYLLILYLIIFPEYNYALL